MPNKNQPNKQNDEKSPTRTDEQSDSSTRNASGKTQSQKQPSTEREEGGRTEKSGKGSSGRTEESPDRSFTAKPAENTEEGLEVDVELEEDNRDV